MKYVGVSSPAWTFSGQETRIKQSAQTALESQRRIVALLGPGKYATDKETRILKKAQSTYTFGGADRFPKIECGPGEGPRLPQTPEPTQKVAFRSNSTRKSHFRSISFNDGIIPGPFGGAKRFVPNKTFLHNPGPGAYQLEGTIAKQESGKYSFAYRNDADPTGAIPASPALGPGTYNPKYAQFIKGFKISKASKPEKDPVMTLTSEKSNRNGLPPKELKAPKKPDSVGRRVVKPRPTFAQAARDLEFKQLIKNGGPSPGAYHVNEHNPAEYGNWTAKAYSFGGRLPSSTEKPSEHPGPNAYPVNWDLLKKNRGFSFAKAVPKEPRMQSFHSRQSLNSQSDDEGGTKQVPKFRGGDMPKAPRQQSCLTVGPGPGAYWPSHHLIEKSPRKTLIGSKIYHRSYFKGKENEKTDRFISENDFKSVQVEAKLGTFGKAARRLNAHAGRMTSDRQAKPQMYNIRESIGVQGFSFARQERYPADPLGNTEIGPGFYEIKSTMPQVQPWIKLGTELG